MRGPGPGDRGGLSVEILEATGASCGLGVVRSQSTEATERHSPTGPGGREQHDIRRGAERPAVTGSHPRAMDALMGGASADRPAPQRFPIGV